MKIQTSLKILPSGCDNNEVYQQVNQAIKMIASSELKYIVGPSETTIEGEYQAIFDLINQIHTYFVDQDIRQITMIIITDYNNQQTYIQEKLANVDSKLSN